jgi:hypothetical protein
VKAWGKVRIELETRITRELVERFPDKFTTDFEDNKKTHRIPYQHFIKKAEKQNSWLHNSASESEKTYCGTKRLAAKQTIKKKMPS